MAGLHENWDDETKWQIIETEYRAGKLSVAAIGRLYGVPADTIRKRARRNDWERQLLPTLECEVRARLLADAEFIPKTDEERIKLLAERQKAAILGHRNDITKIRAIINTLADRANQWLNGEEYDGPFIGEKETPADLVKKLSDATRHLIPLERQAFGIKDEIQDAAPKGQTGVVLVPGKLPLPAAEPDETSHE